MPLFDPTTLYLEINDLVVEIRQSAEITDGQWLQIEGRIDDFIEKLELMTKPVIDRSKGSGAVIGRPYEQNAVTALESVRAAKERALGRAARPTSEALGRASLQLRGGGPTANEQ